MQALLVKIPCFLRFAQKKDYDIVQNPGNGQRKQKAVAAQLMQKSLTKIALNITMEPEEDSPHMNLNI